MGDVEPTDQTRAALDAGVKDIVQDMTQTAAEQTMNLMEGSRGNRLVAYRQGLQELRERLPEYEERMRTLHLELGMRDANSIGSRIAEELGGAASGGGTAHSLALRLRGQDRAAALREASLFKSRIAGRVSGAAGRVLVAVERLRLQERLPTVSPETRFAERVVWLLGAGFSKALGGPLFSELVGARQQRWIESWLEARGVPEGRTPGHIVPVYESGLKTGLWNSAEECLALLDEARGDAVARDVLRDVLNGREIDDVWKDATQFVAAATSHYVDRAFAADDLPEAWTPYERWAELISTSDSIVTFNYDMVVERVLGRAQRGAGTIAKLHGSVPSTEQLIDDIRDGVPVAKIATPGPGKATARSMVAIEKDWLRAEKALETADRLVVIGYSFPPSDSYVRSFILSKCRAARVDIVVGSDQCGDTIAEMFRRSLGLAARDVRNTRLLAQQFLAEGAARPQQQRFDHWLNY